MDSARLRKKVERFSRLVNELLLASGGLQDVPGHRLMTEAIVTLFQIAMHLSERYPPPLESAAIDADDSGMTDDGDWLSTQQGPDKVPMPPSLESERIMGIAGRALVEPAKITEAEMQELAASVLSYIVATKPSRDGRELEE